MRIVDATPGPGWILFVVAEDARTGEFDVSPFLEFEAFAALRDYDEFRRVFNRGYFVEWACGADLSADTIEARWRATGGTPRQAVHQVG